MPWLISKLSEFRNETRSLHVSYQGECQSIHEKKKKTCRSRVSFLICDSYVDIPWLILWVTHSIPELCEYFMNDIFIWRSCVSILRWHATTRFYILTCDDSISIYWHATTHFYILTCHDSFLYIDIPWLFPIKDSFLGWNDLMTSLCVPCLIPMRDMTHSYVSSLIAMCDMNHHHGVALISRFLNIIGLFCWI